MGRRQDRGASRARADRWVLGLVGLFAAASLAVTGLWLAPLHSLPSQLHLPWPALAVGFALCEIFVIHVDRDRQTHTFSLMEVPLVVGLYVVSPVGLVAARLVGSAAALILHRRQPPLKVAFNLSLFASETATAVVVFRLVTGSHPGIGPLSWGAAFLAAMAANLIGAGGVTAAIALSTDGVSRGTFRRMFIEGVLLGPLANTSLALCAAVLLSVEPSAAVLLVSVAAVLILAYRGYSALTRRYANLQRLYDYTRETNDHSEEDDVATIVLVAARNLLHAERAQLILATDNGRGLAVRTRLEADGRSFTDGPLEPNDFGPLWMALNHPGDAMAVAKTTRIPEERELLGVLGWQDCMVVAFVLEGDISGRMALADRTGDVGTFDGEDLALFAALVNHATVTLEKSRLNDRLQHEALHDPLTGLANRSLFSQRMHAALKDRPLGGKLAVLLMDLDRFKEINDTLGHYHGDQLLVEIGRRLQHLARPGTTVARLGGDEFAVLLPAVGDAADALEQATTLAAALQAPFNLGDVNVEAAASIGIAVAPDHGEDPVILLQHADIAMYAAKASGRVEVYSPERDEHSRHRLALVGELRAALDDRALEVWYQPQADASSGAITGAEALVRWNHPQRGLLSPDEFIPVAERTGLIAALTHQVVDQATRQWAQLNDTGHHLGLSVNISTRNLADPDIVENISRRLQLLAIPTCQLTLEITESSIMADPARSLETLIRLAEAGIRLAVDDFGTGYSSLTYLRQLPVNEVKIDKSFVIEMAHNPGAGAIVRSVIDLGRNLDLTVVAEGVETVTAWQQLAAWGCTTIQGYYLSKPLPAPKFTHWLQQRLPNPVNPPARADQPARPTPQLSHLGTGDVQPPFRGRHGRNPTTTVP